MTEAEEHLQAAQANQLAIFEKQSEFDKIYKQREFDLRMRKMENETK